MKIRTFNKSLKSEDQIRRIKSHLQMFNLGFTKAESTKLLRVIESLRGKRNDFLMYPENRTLK